MNWRLIEIWVSIIIVGIVGGLIIFYLGNMVRASSDVQDCVKIGESPLEYNNISWNCENITMARVGEYQGDYNYYKLSCKEDSVEIYKCL